MKTRYVAAVAALCSTMALCGLALVSGQETAAESSASEAAKASADAFSQAAKQAKEAAELAKISTGGGAVWVQNGNNPFGRTISVERPREPFFFAGAGGSTPEGKIREAAARVHDAQDDADREGATTELTSLLDKYFEEDMQSRAKELEEIQKRLTNLQTQLDRRRAKKQEIIDLQMKVALNEADGLGFYSEQKNQLFNFRVPAPVAVPVPMSIGGESFGPAPPSPPLPTLRHGSKGEVVRLLQTTLNKRVKPSPKIDVDGDFGPKTEAAVKEFQSQSELKPTGIVDGETWEAIGVIERMPAPQKKQR